MVKVALICPYCERKTEPNIKELDSEKIKGPIVVTCPSCGAKIDVIRLAIASLVKKAEEQPSPAPSEGLSSPPSP